MQLRKIAGNCGKSRGGRLLAFRRDSPPAVEVGQRPPGGGGRGGIGGGGSGRGDRGGGRLGGSRVRFVGRIRSRLRVGVGIRVKVGFKDSVGVQSGQNGQGE